MLKYRIITVLPFSKYASPILHRENTMENYVSLWISEKSTFYLQMITGKKSSSKHFFRCSPTLGSNILLLQARLLQGLSLFGDGGTTVSGNTCIHLCYQNFRLNKSCTRSEQLCVCFSRLHVKVLGPSCQG